MQTATNPQTGEIAVLIDGAWQKAEKTASNEKGEKAYLVGGKWVGDNASSLPNPEKQKSLADELGRQLGLTVRAGAKGVVAIPSMIGDALGLNTSGAVDALLSKLLPTPQNATERIAQDVAGAMAGGGAIGAAANLSKPLGAVAQSVAQQLAANQGMQTAATMAGSGASSATREAGGGELAQLSAGLAVGVGVPMAIQAVRNIPGNMIASSIQKSESKPFAQEGKRLREATGIELSPGAETGNKMLLGMENTARQYGPLADRVQDIDVKIANQAIKRVNTLADNISAAKSDPIQLGTKIEETVKSAAKSIDLARDRTAAIDFGKVRELAGDAPVIKLKNFSDELQNLINEYKNVPGSDAEKITSQASAALRRITGQVSHSVPAGAVLSLEGTPLVPAQSAIKGTIDNTITEAMKARRFYGQASKGAANVFEDIAPNMNRQIGARLFGAINKDFDESALNASGTLREALDTANKNYKQFSQSLEYLEKSTLGKLIGEDVADAAISGAKASTTAGEAVIQKLMTTYPSSRKAAIDILERWNPSLAKDFRAFVLRDALDKGMSIPPSTKGAGQIPISFNKFVNALQGDKVGFEKQLASYGFKKNEISDIKDTVAAMVRAGDRTGYNYSNTGVMQQNTEIAGAMGDAAMGNIKGAASKVLSIGGKYIGLGKIADAMESEKGRAALRTLSSAKASPQSVIEAFATIE